MKLVEAVFPDESTNVYVTVVVPTGKSEPGACDLDCRDTLPELSVAVGSVHVTVVAPKPAGIVLVMSSMAETTGALLSAEKRERCSW